MAPPCPAFARRYEAYLGHQVANGGLVQAKAGCERPVDGILAAILPDMMGVGRQTIGQVYPKPVGSKPAEGKCRPARIGASV